MVSCPRRTSTNRRYRYRSRVSVPSTLGEVLVVVAVVLPGLVFGTVRSWLRGFGPEDVSGANRVAQAFVVGVLFDLLYIALLGQWLVQTASIDDANDARAWAGWAILLGVALPGAVAYFWFGRPFRLLEIRGRQLPVLLSKTPYRSTPTAWDRKIPHLGGKFVRIEMPNGSAVAGWYGAGSYASTYPHPRDLYLEHQYAVREDGTLDELEGTQQTAGVWVSVPEGAIVIFTNPESEEKL